MGSSGPYYLDFNGDGGYAEVPSSADFSVDKNLALSIAAWMRRDQLNFARLEGSHYVPNTQDCLFIDPRPGNALVRFGTRDFRSFFAGGLAEIRVWSRALNGDEISEFYNAGTVPRDGLVAEFLLNEGSGETAHDSTGNHDAPIFGATWKTLL